MVKLTWRRTDEPLFAPGDVSPNPTTVAVLLISVSNVGKQAN